MSRKHWVSGLILLAMPLAVSPLAMAAHSGNTAPRQAIISNSRKGAMTATATTVP